MDTNQQFKSDYRIIMKAYQAGVSLAKGQKKLCVRDVPCLVRSAKQYIDVLSSQVDHTGFRNAVRAAKAQVLIFAEWVARNPAKIKEEDYETMNTLLTLTGEYEASYIQKLREKETLGYRINLKKILEKPDCLKKVLGKEMDRIVEEEFADSRALTISKRQQQFFVTAAGEKYHRQDCPYCKARELYLVTEKMIENFGCLPCRCVTEEEKEHASAHIDLSAVTIFVDESVRKNPFHPYDESLPEYEGIYSFVVCQGKLESENEIQEGNLIKECASIADEYDEALNVTNVTIEGICKALMWTAYRYGFHGEVSVFVDNLGALGKLKKTGNMMHLEKLFEKVTFRHIPRTANKRADMVGRREIIFHASQKVIEELLKAKKNADAVAEAERKEPVTRLQDIMIQKRITLFAMQG